MSAQSSLGKVGFLGQGGDRTNWHLKNHKEFRETVDVGKSCVIQQVFNAGRCQDTVLIVGGTLISWTDSNHCPCDADIFLCRVE